MLKKNLFIAFVLLGALIMNPRLVLTDGTNIINLLGCVSGYDVDRWFQQFAQYKGGGVLQNSSLANGQRIIDHRFDSITDEFPLTVNGATNDGFAYTQQELSRMLEKAAAYWENDWNNEPVWLERRAPCETETSYALVNYGSILEFADQMNEGFALDSAQGPLALRINHGLWMSHEPFDSECVELSATQDYFLSAAEVSITAQPAAASDDASAIPVFSLLSFVGGGARFGRILALGIGQISYDSGVRFTNVAVPQGATIVSAYITFESQILANVNECNAIIMIEKSDNAATFSTWADWTHRKRLGNTFAMQWYDIQDWALGGFYNTPDMTFLVQQIVNRAGWASGNAMAFFIVDDESDDNAFRDWTTFDGAPTMPVLHITYVSTAVEMGRDATCD